VIQAVDKIPVEKIIQEAESVMRPPINERNRVGLITKAVLGRVYGAPGTEVSIAYSNAGGGKGEKTMVRTKRSGRAVGPSGILYLAVELEARRLENGVGYIRLNTFQPPLVAQVSNAIRSLGNVPGIIFDVRGNAGGEIEGMPDLFLKERALLYLSRSRKGETKVFVDPATDAFKGPLVLLVDQLTGSAGELFAGSLQAIGRAVVVGERSPGAVTESDMKVLSNGAIFMYPVAQLATPDGTVLEGHGVAPNIEVGLDRDMLLKGIDSQLEAAVRYLGKGTKK
jgi:C-terminal peptidase prc